MGTGRFSAVLWSESGPGAEETPGPRDVSVDEAIVWGRAQADVAVVMVCDDAGGASYFSAGELEPPTWEAGTLYPWPVSGDLLTARRVASGRRDASVEVSGVWEVELVAYGDGGEAPKFA